VDEKRKGNVKLLNRRRIEQSEDKEVKMKMCSDPLCFIGDSHRSYSHFFRPGYALPAAMFEAATNGRHHSQRQNHEGNALEEYGRKSFDTSERFFLGPWEAEEKETCTRPGLRLTVLERKPFD